MADPLLRTGCSGILPIPAGVERIGERGELDFENIDRMAQRHQLIGDGRAGKGPNRARPKPLRGDANALDVFADWLGDLTTHTC